MLLNFLDVATHFSSRIRKSVLWFSCQSENFCVWKFTPLKSWRFCALRLNPDGWNGKFQKVLIILIFLCIQTHRRNYRFHHPSLSGELYTCKGWFHQKIIDYDRCIKNPIVGKYEKVLLILIYLDIQAHLFRNYWLDFLHQGLKGKPAFFMFDFASEFLIDELLF